MLYRKIQYRSTLYYRTLLFKLGLGNRLLKNRYGERILLFHGVDENGDNNYNSRFISASYFESLISYFSTHFNIISVDDFFKRKFKDHVLNIALTFDDGYLNNHKFVVPILEKYGIPASFYITTIHKIDRYLWPDFLDLVSYYTTKEEIIFKGITFLKNNRNEFVAKNMTLKNKCKQSNYSDIASLYTIFQEDWEQIKSSPLEDYWKLMTYEHIKSIAKNPLFSIGSHALTHSNLTKISEEEAKFEIMESTRILKEELNIPINEFAFPFGSYSDGLIDFCEKEGFSKILLVGKNKKHTPRSSILERFLINPYISKKHLLASLLKGSYY